MMPGDVAGPQLGSSRSDHGPVDGQHRDAQRILLVAAGLTPQIVTETVWALAVGSDPPWMPTQIHLITTANGAERARLALLSSDQDWFGRLLHEFSLTAPRFDDSTIHVLQDDEGRPIEDIRTEQDNRSAADQIVDLVRTLTTDDSSAVHVSIAGGRKTMGFYLGYALSLYGRQQDRMSHVLVSAPYESHPGFFFPTRESRVIYTPPPDSRPLDTSRATVTLARIPFVRLRAIWPRGEWERSLSFNAAVRAVQHRIAREIHIDLAACSLAADGKRVPLRPAELAFYSMMARRVVDGKEKLACPGEGADKDLAADFLAEYERARGAWSDFDRTRLALRDGMDRAYFLQRRSRVHQALRDALGPRASQYAIGADGRRPNTRYGLELSPEQITYSSDEGDAEE